MNSFKLGNQIAGKSTVNRRDFLFQIAAATGGMILSGCVGKKPTSLPNILLIISDDQGWGDYGFMGHEAIQTPNLDRLATESVVFTRGYVAAPLCCPSLASIISGLHPHQHQITSNDPPYDEIGNRWNPLEWSTARRQQREAMMANFDVELALPRRLSELGYRSLQTGKWWLGHYRQGGFTHGMTHGDLDRGGRHGDAGLDIGRKTMQPIYDFIDNVENQPFFIWYAPFLPHTPHNPPERILKKYLQKTNSTYVARYWANCEWFDETCGDLLNYLEQKNLAENTMILYICDNGWIQQPDQNGYAERSKRTPYEGGIRTLMMVKWPAHTVLRIDTTTLVSSLDLVPTILKACGLEPTHELPGVNLLDPKALKKRKAIFGAAFTHDAVDINKPITSLKYSYAFQGEWKLIQPSGRNGTGTSPELYNVLNDPKETTDVAANHPEMVAQLQIRIKEWWSEALPEQFRKITA